MNFDTGRTATRRLAAHLVARQEAILLAWRQAVRSDPLLTTADSLPREKLNDHIPGLLDAYACRLDPTLELNPAGPAAEPEQVAAADGLNRWQQGYDLHELSSELDRLNECVVRELEHYALQRPHLAPEVMSKARSAWAELSGLEISHSTAEDFRLQQLEAAAIPD